MNSPDERADITLGGSGPYELPGVGAVVESEFAQIAVTVDDAGNSVRLRLADLRTGRVRYLDAIELEAIIWLHGDCLNAMLDPSADRWRE